MSSFIKLPSIICTIKTLKFYLSNTRLVFKSPDFYATQTVAWLNTQRRSHSQANKVDSSYIIHDPFLLFRLPLIKLGEKKKKAKVMDKY